MPVRSFRMIIQNATSSLTLSKTAEHRCWGDWTPGGWTPPAVIGPGKSGGMQAESGFVTGTEGWTKYNVDSSEGRLGMIYIYWNNPIYGVTAFRPDYAFDDVVPDCDYSDEAGGSTFVGTPPTDKDKLGFEFGSTGFGGQGGNFESPGEAFLHIFGSTGLPAMIGLARIIPHAEVLLLLRERAKPEKPQGFVGTFAGELGQKSLRVLRDATPEQWVSRWSDGQITVDITPTHTEPPLRATVIDWTASPRLTFNEVFKPGPESLMRSSWFVKAIEAHAQDPILQSVLTAAAQASLTQPKFMNSPTPEALTPPPGAAPTRTVARTLTEAMTAAVTERIAKTATNLPTTVSVAKSEIFGMSVVKLVADRGGVAYLGHDVVLRLYGVFQQGAMPSYQLQYQRAEPNGHVVSAMLNPLLDVH